MYFKWLNFLNQKNIILASGSPRRKELLEKGLISRIKDKNGRSYNIKTTPKFAEYFKLKGDIRTLVKTLKIDEGVKDE